MAKSKKTLEITQTKTKANRQEIQINDMDYTTSAEPKAFADGRPVFCAHDKIVPIKELRENRISTRTIRSELSLLSLRQPAGGSRSP